MVTVFSGEVNSGKTTEMFKTYKNTLKGDGIVSIKTMEGKGVKCYDALELSTGRKWRLAYHDDFRPKEFMSATKLGPYSFDEKVFVDIKGYIHQCLMEGKTPIYLDEIGVLELKGSGFADILKNLIENNIDTVIAVRSDLVERVITAYKISDYNVITVNRNEGEGCSI